MIKIGLTGGICTGKSHVLTLLKQYGAFTIKADEISKTLLFGKNSSVRDDIYNQLGLDISDTDAAIEPDLMSKIIFSDPEKRLIVNNIVHPQVKKIRDQLFADIEKEKKHPLFVYESALLVESGTYRDFDRIIVVYCDIETQMKRLMERDQIDKNEAEKKIKSQLPLREKLKIAHYTVDTSGSTDQTYTRTLEIISLIQRDFKLNLNLIE